VTTETSRMRTGSTVYAAVEITQEHLFPTAQGVYYISIPRNSKGKIMSTVEEGLYLVDFGKLGSWYVPRSIVSRNKTK
jgi:hypothetical protein